jgi:uncharacterized surface protein with fasciclin (FAS1) repeats
MKTLLNALTIGTLSLAVVACETVSSPVSPSAIGGSDTPLTSASADDATRPSLTAMGSRPDMAAAAKPGDMTIVGIVLQNDGEFDVLQTAVGRAGLVDALNGATQYTVFAPTDAAFVKTLGAADEAAATAAINGLPLDALTDILLYHVVEGRRNSRSVLAAPRYTTLGGKTLSREQLTAAGLATTDMSASNGIIHVINAVLLPS